MEVRKFGHTEQTPEQAEYASLQHNMIDTMPYEVEDSVRNFLREYSVDKESADTTSWLNQAVEDLPKGVAIKPSEFRRRLLRYAELGEKLQGEVSSKNPTHWQSIAPKPESEMKDYVEIAVVRPTTKTVKGLTLVGNTNTGFHYTKDGQKITKNFKSVDEATKWLQRDDTKFPSSHNFPPNTLGFVRGYMEGDTFHVIEVQSDWAKIREAHDKGPNGPYTEYGTFESLS